MVANTTEHGGAAEFWEGVYRDRPSVWSGRANPVLVDEVADLLPGTALDLGCGEGGDAIWLAERGWDVTAVDVSDTALGRAATRAADAGVAQRIAWQRHDLARWVPEGTFDLVSAQFLQSPVELPRAQILQAAAGAVVPGGTLLVVGHAASPPWAHDHDPDRHFPTPAEDLAELALSLEQWDVERCETVERQAEGPDGQPGTLIDSILLLRRRRH